MEDHDKRDRLKDMIPGLVHISEIIRGLINCFNI